MIKLSTKRIEKPTPLLFLTLICVLLISSCNSTLLVNHKSKSSDKEDIMIETAKKELSDILDKIPEGQESHFGFKSKEDFELAKVEAPFQVYRYTKEGLLESSYSITPISVNNKYAALASIDTVNQELHIVDFGASLLAQDLQKKIKQNPDYTYKGLVKIYSISSDFALMEKGKDLFLVPLISAEMFLADKNIVDKKIFTVAEIKDLLHEN